MAWSLKDMFTCLYAYMLVNWVIAGTDTGILPTAQNITWIDVDLSWMRSRGIHIAMA